MLNREQRRAQLKQLSKKFSGIDITRGTIEVPIKGCDEPLTIDTNNFDTIYQLAEMCDKFINLKSAYKEEYNEVESMQDKHGKAMAMIKLYRRIIQDFTTHVDAIFGDGTTKRVFGNEAPMPTSIAEFIEDISPIASVLVSTVVAGAVGLEGSEAAGVAADAASRVGNA